MLHGKERIQFLFILISVVLSDAFSYDYYFGEMRASDRRDGYLCDDLYTLKTCNDRCGELVGTCYKRECYCLVKYTPESDKYTMQQLDRPIKRTYPESILSRRHHIAHFCPNLEVARTCIRKCMKLGKPAFCGKDHVCYCGHRYSGHDKNEKINVTAVRNAFYDLYEKYFGPQYARLDPRHDHKLSGNNDETQDYLGYKKAVKHEDSSEEEIPDVERSQEDTNEDDTLNDNRNKDDIPDEETKLEGEEDTSESDDDNIIILENRFTKPEESSDESTNAEAES